MMGFFIKGPPKDVVLTMALGVASSIMSIIELQNMREDLRLEISNGMKATGEPASIEEVVEMAAAPIHEQHMGWVRKNQYIGFIRGYLLGMDVPEYDVKYLTNQIQLRAGF